MKKDKFIFFGSSRFSCLVLDELASSGFLPSLIVATPSKPSGRKLAITEPPTKIWADLHSIPCFQPENLRDESVKKRLEEEVNGKNKKADENSEVKIFIVASYGKIIPKDILNIPARGTLNVHPSLLPKFRGPTPIQSAILAGEKTGVTIILLDQEVDHGPILGQEELSGNKIGDKLSGETNIKTGNENWPPYADILEEKLANLGGKLLAKIIPDWIDGKIEAVPQNHAEATFTKKITKEDGLIDFTDLSDSSMDGSKKLSSENSESSAINAEKIFRKIRAYSGWPNAFFFAEHRGKKIRVVAKEAELLNGKIKITKVIPEGKKEMPYEDFLRGLREIK